MIKRISAPVLFLIVLLIHGFMTIQVTGVTVTGPLDRTVEENLNEVIALYQNNELDEAIALLRFIALQMTYEDIDPDESITFEQVKHWHTQHIGDFIIWDMVYNRFGDTTLIGQGYTNEVFSELEYECEYFVSVFSNADRLDDIAVLFFHKDNYPSFRYLLNNNIYHWTIVAEVLPAGDTKTIPVLKVLQFYETPPSEDNE